MKITNLILLLYFLLFNAAIVVGQNDTIPKVELKLISKTKKKEQLESNEDMNNRYIYNKEIYATR